MKGRESGMPDEAYWASFFNADCILTALQCAPLGDETIVEFGCGYGTFTLPATSLTSGKVYSFDIEASMIEHTKTKAHKAGLNNILLEQRDFLETGSGLDDGCADHVMIYNLLHIKESLQLLTEAHRILKADGALSIIHWNPDPDTPRGPPMEMRPTPGDCRQLAEQTGFTLLAQPDLTACCEHHFGLTFKRQP